jgi:hypothetical protein
MNDDDKNEPAFPGGVNTKYTNLDEGAPTQPGMTLRDYFAAAAMQGDWASLGPNEDRPESCFPKAARDYYSMADAMLAARNEPKKDE